MKNQKMIVRYLSCFFYLFALSGLVMGSMNSDFFKSIFGRVSQPIPSIFGIPFLFLIRNQFKDIQRVLFGVLFALSLFFYILLVILFIK